MTDIDYKALTFWLHIFEFICIGVVALYSWLANRYKANNDAIQALGTTVRNEVNGLDDRVIKIEETINHLPTHDDVAKLHRRVDECAQAITKLEGTVGQMNNNVRMIHQHLLSSKG